MRHDIETVRWTLDRRDDAAAWAALDRLEMVTERYEAALVHIGWRMHDAAEVVEHARRIAREAVLGPGGDEPEPTAEDLLEAFKHGQRVNVVVDKDE